MLGDYFYLTWGVFTIIKGFQRLKKSKYKIGGEQRGKNFCASFMQQTPKLKSSEISS